jgi:hypothetical protein
MHRIHRPSISRRIAKPRHYHGRRDPGIAGDRRWHEMLTLYLKRGREHSRRFEATVIRALALRSPARYNNGVIGVALRATGLTKRHGRVRARQSSTCPAPAIHELFHRHDPRE